MQRGEGRLLGPAGHGDFARARVHADPDASGIALRGPRDQLRLFDGGGADDHAIDSGAEPTLDRVEIANAAAELGGDVLG
jgi:hypothetical protein